MAVLDRNAILQAQDLQTQDVDVPEWGGSVRVRSLTGAERETFGKALMGADGKPDLTGYAAKLLALCIVDEAGASQFTEADVQVLQGKAASALERVFRAAEKLNGMAADSVEAAEKN